MGACHIILRLVGQYTFAFRSSHFAVSRFFDTFYIPSRKLRKGCIAGLHRRMVNDFYVRQNDMIFCSAERDTRERDGTGTVPQRESRLRLYGGIVNLTSCSNWSATFVFARITFLPAAGLLAYRAFTDQN